jgi:cytochrome c oxidase assembly protein subunit 15
MTSTPAHSRSLHWFAVVTALCTLVLIGVGGLVTSHGAGMAVPNWPNSYDYNMFAFPISEWVGGVLYEHTHRLVASFVGLLTTVLAAWLWMRESAGRTRSLGLAVAFVVPVLLGVRQMPIYLALAGTAVIMIPVGLWLSHRERWSLRWIGMVALAAVVLQGVLGGLRVVWMADEVGIFHGTIAQLFLVLLVLIALLTSAWWERARTRVDGLHACAALRRVLQLTTLMILGQLMLGATMRHQHAGLAIPDFPLAYGAVWPDTSAEAVMRYNQQRIEVMAHNPITAAQIHLQMLHRIVALAIVGMVVSSAVMVWRRFESGHVMRVWAGLWLGLIAVQFGLGAWTVWSNKAADIASLHVVNGSLCLTVGGVLCVLAARHRPVSIQNRVHDASPDCTTPILSRPSAARS